MRDTKREGEVAEAAFKYKALTLGLKVLVPLGDSERYDVVIHSGRKFSRVQVRSTRTMSRWKMYSVASCYKINHGSGRATEHVPYTEKEIDILAVLLVPEDTWYILPVAALRRRVRLNLYSREHKRPGPEAEYKEAWERLGE